jgi:hypothetical protein
VACQKPLPNFYFIQTLLNKKGVSELLRMYIRMKTSKKAKYPTLQVVEGVREGKKVKQRTIAHLGMIKSQQDLQRLKNLADKLI